MSGERAERVGSRESGDGRRKAATEDLDRKNGGETAALRGGSWRYGAVGEDGFAAGVGEFVSGAEVLE